MSTVRLSHPEEVSFLDQLTKIVPDLRLSRKEHNPPQQTREHPQAAHPELLGVPLVYRIAFAFADAGRELRLGWSWS